MPPAASMNMLRTTGIPEHTSATPASGAKCRRYSSEGDVEDLAHRERAEGRWRHGRKILQSLHARASRLTLDYRQHLEVETPEHVMLDLEIAGIGSRALAAVLDMIILVGAYSRVVIVLAILGGYGLTVGRLGGAILLLGGFAAWTGYFIFFEGLRRADARQADRAASAW